MLPLVAGPLLVYKQSPATMGCLYGLLTELFGLLIVNDGPVVFLVIAFAGSLCCSVIWRLFALLSNDGGLSVSSVKRKRLRTPKAKVVNGVLLSKFERSNDELFCLKGDFPVVRRNVETSSASISQSNLQGSSLQSSRALVSSQPLLLHFDQSYSCLSNCPQRLGFLGTQLRSLNLSHNNLTDLPDEIGCLLGLEELYLCQNDLRSVPETLQNLRRLAELDLQNNKLTSLGNGLTKLHRLKLLLVNNNSLTHLPTDFHNLQSLEHLDLSFNDLCWLPDNICSIYSLETLNVSNNLLTYLPEKMNRLVRLMHFTASCCRLVSLPRSICECVQLISICVSKNRLQQLPDEIGQLFNLQFLSVDGNRLQYLPFSISSLYSCHILVEDNCFISLSPSNPVILSMASRSQTVAAVSMTKVTSLSHPLSLNVVSLLEQSAFCILNNDVKWQHENLPQTLKDILTNVHYCVCCKRPLFLWQQMQISSHSLVSRTGLKTDVPLVQSLCPLRSQLIPCTFVDI